MAKPLTSLCMRSVGLFSLAFAALFVLFGVGSFATAADPAPCSAGNTSSLPFFDFADNFWSDSENCVVGKPITDLKDSPIEEGAGNPGTELKGSAFDNNGSVIVDTEDARTKTLNYIRGLVNYALGILALVALLYLIYHAILTATAWSDEAQAKKWREGVKFAAIALAWLGASWFIVSIIIFLINLITVRFS